jgi:hypothetical protein
MIKRARTQQMFANTTSDRWLRVAVAVAEPAPSDACARYWQARAALPMLESVTGPRKRAH